MVTREIPALEGGVKSCYAPQIYLTLVDNTEDHLSGELTVRQLSIGNDDENAGDGLTVGKELAVGADEEFADLTSSNTTHDSSEQIFADEMCIRDSNMTSRSKKDYAYTILDVTDAISEGCIQKIEAIDGVIRIRVI